MKYCINCNKVIGLTSKRCISCHNKSHKMRQVQRNRSENLTNMVFGSLKVIKRSRKKWGEMRLWQCLCQCGKTVFTTSYKLKTGHTKSCGCYNKSRATIHGMGKTRFNQIFRSLNYRCTNPKATKYHLYGGKGIKCLWENFEDFKNDMYDSYIEHVKKFGEKETTIDRIDGNKHYCKENCRWATRLEQARNTETTKRILYNGKNLTLGEWADIFNINKKVLANRLYANWSIEKALTK